MPGVLLALTEMVGLPSVFGMELNKEILLVLYYFVCMLTGCCRDCVNQKSTAGLCIW